MVEQRLRERGIEELLGERAVRDAKSHRDTQQVDRGARRILMLDRTSVTPARVEGHRPGSRDEEEHGDPEDVDLLEDALDAERHHRCDPEESEEDRRVPREQPGQ